MIRLWRSQFGGRPDQVEEGYMSKRRSLGLYASALLATSALVLSACGGSSDSGGSASPSDGGSDSSSSSSSAEPTESESESAAEYNATSGVPYGTTKEEYIAALADMDEVTLTIQSPSPEGANTGRRFEEWAAAVTEWSGGKIQWEWAFANAIAPAVEIDDALKDGRLDVASSLPTYEPDQYPANADLIGTSFLGVQSPIVNSMASLAWMVETAYANPAVIAEFEDNGIKLLSPIFNSGVTVMMCKEPRTTLDEMNGIQISVTSPAASTEVTAMGMTPTSIPYTELFEALERGVVDCANSSLLVGGLIGFLPAAPQVTQDPRAGFAVGTGSFGMNMEVWDGLPLTAQQLMFDKLDVFYSVNVDSSLVAASEGTTAVLENKGKISPMDDAAVKALEGANQSLIAEMAAKDTPFSAGIAASAEETSAAWSAYVQELGYSDPEDLNTLPEYLAANPVDPTEWMNAFYETVLLPQRPA